MRPLFYAYPQDAKAWEVEDSYLFGDDILVAPVMEEGAVQRPVYLPQGETWREVATGKRFEGGQWVQAEAPLEVIPLFVREGSQVEL